MAGPGPRSRGERVRCLARTPACLAGRFSPTTDIVKGDVPDPKSLRAALEGVHTASCLVEAAGSGSRITRTAVFDLSGVSGLLHWYGLHPLHWSIFRGMLGGIVRAGVDEPASPDVVRSVHPSQLPS